MIGAVFSALSGRSRIETPPARPRVTGFLLILLSAALLLSASARAGWGGRYGTFVPTGDMSTARAYHTATLLSNGKVLVAGGRSGFRNELDSAELYDPVAHRFIPTGRMLSARARHTATLLPNGKVLIAGGFRAGEALASAELFDPVSGTFSATANLTMPRQWHSATLLPDGRVLIAGGAGNGNQMNDMAASAEIYDPAAGKFVATGNMTVARVLHAATALKNGGVFIIGGMRGGGPDPMLWAGNNFLSSAELFDPGTGQFNPLSGMSVGERAASNGSAVLLADGKVLIAGGVAGRVTLSDARLYDPSQQKFLPTGSMISSRFRHDATLLSDGRVLVTGGFKTFFLPPGPLVVATAELYDPGRGAFIALPDMTTPRIGHTVTLLPDGEVLIAGGMRGSLVTGLSAAELYRPASAAGWAKTGPARP